MPVTLDSSRVQTTRRPGAVGFMPRPGDTAPVAKDWIEIGVINNMPDAALCATEQQFMELLTVGGGGMLVRLHFFCLPEIQRGPAAREHLRLRYADVADLGRKPLDALIITGNAPRAAALESEPYWKSLTAVIDWARENTKSTIFSCLAAHAAVLHLDGIQRRRLATKCTGIYRCFRGAEHPLLAGVGPHLSVPHSRWNDLSEDDLVARGYTILTRAGEAGVDMFAKNLKSLFLFFQGHPEYQPDSLLREYRRDVARSLRGEAEGYPRTPDAYFTPASEAELAALARQMPDADADFVLAKLARAMRIRPALVRRWRAGVVPLIGNWLHYLAAQKRRATG